MRAGVGAKYVKDWEEGVGLGLGGIHGCRGLGKGSLGMGLGGFKVGVSSPLSRNAGEGQGEGRQSSKFLGRFGC